MIILDTNVISEIMRPEPSETVKSWIAVQKPLKLGITVITLAEIKRGLYRLPKGKKRQRLETGFAEFIQAVFRGRIFSFDQDAAELYGILAHKRVSQGLHVDAVDLMIASIAKTHKASIATRNVQDFSECDIQVINPWSATS